MKKSKESKRPERMSLLKINTKFRKKLVVLFVAVILALVALTARITYINATSGEEYKRIVLNNIQSQYENVVLPYKRGDITDRNGTLLATSERVYNLILDCTVVNYEEEDDDGNTEQPYREPTIDALVSQFGLDREEIISILDSDETKNSQYQILKKDISMDDEEAFEAYCDIDDESNRGLTDDEKIERSCINGIWFEESYKRVYPQNSMACDTIGFTYATNEASWGIEGYYSDILNGVNGRRFGYFNSDADVEQTIIEPVNGNNVVSTIDVNIQEIVRNAIVDYMNSNTGAPNNTQGAENIAVIVMDPNSGEILAMDSTDWYDLNNPRDLSSILSADEIANMSEEEEIEKLNEIWRNYCVSDAFEPGSVVKPLTVAAGLETAKINDTEIYKCDGGEEINGTEIHCTAYPNSHGDLTIYTAIAYSCNDALMQIVKSEGAETFLKYYANFNFGSRTGIDLPGENAGIIYSADSIGDVELATSSFGQGITCTMIQEAAAICSVINGGYYYKPHVVSAITDEDGNIVERYDPVIERQTVSKSTSETIKKAMNLAVTIGTAQEIKVNGYSMGAKTGTAEKLPRGDGRYLTSVIGFAPYDDPQVVVYVLVDEPNAENQADSTYAQEIGKQIFTELLPYLGVFPDETVVEEEDDEEESEETTTVTAAEQTLNEGISDENIPAPLEGETSDEVLYGGNNIYSEGIENSALEGQ